MVRNRIRRLSAAVAAAGVLALIPTSDAAAWTNSYCGYLIDTGFWCGDRSDHTYDSNRARYYGSGSVTVCERLINSVTRATRGGSSCATNSVYNYYGATTQTLFEADVTHWSGSSRHTIYGEAVA